MVDFQPLVGYISDMKYRRFIQKKIFTALKDTPVVFLNGPRQAGKSTLVENLKFKQSHFTTLDNLLELELAKTNPAAFLNRFNSTLIIDEVQRAPELFIAIKQQVDKNRKPGRFLLTGSANVLLLPKISESLVGRMEILTLQPLSLGEIHDNERDIIDQLFQKKIGIPSKRIKIFEQIISGGFPEVHTRLKYERKSAWFNSYITTLIQRDIRNLANIEGFSKIPKLLSLLAARSGSLLSFNELSRSTGIPTSTLKRYFIILETVFLTYTIPAWSTNKGKRLVKSPKVYLNDSGMLCFLLGVNSESLEQNPLWGRIFETFVINELRKLATWTCQLINFYHFRTHSGIEVDLVLEARNEKIIGIEIKASKNLQLKDFEGLKYLKETYPDRFQMGAIIYLGSEIIQVDKEIVALPVSVLS
ncbi:MAG: ATPase [Chlamydiae bacterium CG10_big_fil_rev_8_21_14_0_10_35_9]|nr:MAG: ATPase [Chlamydiae bacterium CG10_big_fil_rev_8_21_14_0_10_35_9]